MQQILFFLQKVISPVMVDILPSFMEQDFSIFLAVLLRQLNPAHTVFLSGPTCSNILRC